MKGLRFVIDIKKKDEKAFMELLHKLVQKGIVTTANVHMREQEVN